MRAHVSGAAAKPDFHHTTTTNSKTMSLVLQERVKQIVVMRRFSKARRPKLSTHFSSIGVVAG